MPGLTLNDIPELALFWNKTGLGHNDQRLSGGGHIVWFINGDRRHIPAAEREPFVAQQKQLQQIAGRLSGFETT